MKLRIRGDSLRLRLSKEEVAEIAAGRPVVHQTRFAGGGSLSYSLVPGPNPGIHARFRGEVIEVELSRELGRDWAGTSEKISLETSERIDGGGSLSILIEKDFYCRSPRSRPEDESDLFPNPNQRCGG